MKCLVCGAQINDKNFDINSAAFIDKNNKDGIIYCPFCGVNEVFLSSSEKVFSISSSELDENTLKILDHGVKLEIFNGDFYELAAKRVINLELKEMFKALCNIERMHAKVHFKLGGFKKFPVLSKVSYEKYNSDAALLELANIKEKHAVNFYEKNECKINNEIVKKVFRALCDVEKGHVDITTK
ncbi:MAG: ferritin family protein [Clostridium sp.]|nr:ferritin family protein [Clostridium sp.]